MELSQELRTLANFSAGDALVISIYLHTQWHDQHQQERVHTFLTRHLHQAQALMLDTDVARSSLARDVERVAQWGQRLLDGSAGRLMPGMALFACHAADVWVELSSPRPFEDAFVLDQRPALRQLARLDEDYHNALLVLVNSRAARVYEIVLGGIVGEVDFTNAFPGRHKQGGWAQMRYQRHVQEHMARHHIEVATHVSAYLTAHPQTALMLSGPHDVVSHFRSTLPASLQERILETLRLDMHANRRRLLDAAQEVLQEYEQAEEHEAVQRVLDRVGQNGLAVVGLQTTLDAVNTARVQQLVMQHSMMLTGWRCMRCDYLMAQVVLPCPQCGGEVTTVDLGEAIVGAVFRTDGTVELVQPDARLTPYEGIGALVRYH